MKISRKISIRGRFTALMALCALAIVVPSALYTQSGWSLMRFTERETEGLAPARAMIKVIRLAQQHRGLSSAWLSGDESQGAVRAAKAEEVARAVEGVNALVAAHTATGSPLGKTWSGATSRWQAIVQDVQARKVDAATSSARQTVAITGLLDTSDAMLAHWGLFLDPDAATYYNVIATMQEMPRFIEIMGQMRARGAGLLAAGGSPGPTDRVRFETLASQLDQQFARVSAALQHAVQEEDSDADRAAL